MSPVLPAAWDAILGNLSQASALVVYGFVDPLQLQVCAFCSATAQVIFFALQRPPVFIFAFWDTLQACINVLQIWKLVLDLTPVAFSAKELRAAALLHDAFDALAPRTLAHVLRRCGARWVVVAPGRPAAHLVDRDVLLLVVEGDLDLLDDSGKLVRRAATGAFVGESALSRVMGADPGAPRRPVGGDETQAAAAVEARAATTGSCVCLVWGVPALAAFLKRDAEACDAFRTALAIDLVVKLRLDSVYRTRRAQLAQPKPDTKGLGAAKSNGDGSNSTVGRAVAYASAAVGLSKKHPSTDASYGSLLDAARNTDTDAGVEAADAAQTPPRRQSLSALRQGSVKDVLGFVSGATRSSPDSTRSRAGAGFRDVPRRPQDVAAERRFQFRAAAQRAATAAAVALAVVAAAALGYKEGPSSLVGNGSQAIITGAFAVVDPVMLQVVSFTGSMLQACFFIFRSERIWSSIAWSSAQALLTGSMALALHCRKRRHKVADEDVERFSERQMFVARRLQRAAKLEPATLSALVRGDAKMRVRWVRLDAAATLDAGALTLVCDGSVRCAGPGVAYDAHRGALVGGEALMARYEREVLMADRGQVSFASGALLETRVLGSSAECVQWPLDTLASFLKEHHDAKLAFSALIASGACETYMDSVDAYDTPEAARPPETSSPV
ncbi:hypothetical protein M885DRAFT_612446 [Pelagophyceae sp. CCMP2097]|nr:hypothetical protein M885DRAFT_612446 [Pelagophyceae sp. CCMP2097]